MQVTQFTENWYVCLHFFCFKVSATFSNVCEIFCSTDWFQQPQEFTNEIENMGVDELIKCLAKFYVSVRKTDRSYYKKTSLLSIRATLDRHRKAPKSLQKNVFFILVSWIIIFTFIKFNSLFTACTIKRAVGKDNRREQMSHMS